MAYIAPFESAAQAATDSLSRLPPPQSFHHHAETNCRCPCARASKPSRLNNAVHLHRATARRPMVWPREHAPPSTLSLPINQRMTVPSRVQVGVKAKPRGKAPVPGCPQATRMSVGPPPRPPSPRDNAGTTGPGRGPKRRASPAGGEPQRGARTNDPLHHKDQPNHEHTRPPPHRSMLPPPQLQLARRRRCLRGTACHPRSHPRSAPRRHPRTSQPTPPLA
jgi:hypothetical protein